MRPEARTRMMRALLAALMRSDLSAFELRELAQEMSAGRNFGPDFAKLLQDAVDRLDAANSTHATAAAPTPLQTHEVDEESTLPEEPPPEPKFFARLHPFFARINPVWVVGAAAAAVYFVLRSSTDFVWNDTIGMFLQPADALHRLLSLRDVFGSVSRTSNYRPLANYIAGHAVILVGTGTLNFTLWLAAIAAFVGATAVAMLQVARRLLASQFWALVSTILFFFSPAFLTGNWVVLAGQQMMVPLLMCLGVLFYLATDEATRRPRTLSVAGLAMVLLIGPWFREALAVVPVLVILEEARRRRRTTWIMGLGALGLLHALFPMVLPRLALGAPIPVIPAPLLGDVGAQLGRPESGRRALLALVDLGALRYGVSGQLAALFPPSLAILSAVGFVSKSYRELAGTGTRFPNRSANWLVKIRRRPALSASASLAVLTAIEVIVLRLLPDSPARAFIQSAMVDVLIGAAFALYGWSASPLLGAWMALTLLPFYWFFTEIVHLAYPMVPAAIIAAAGLRECWLAVRRLNGSLARPLQYVLVAVTAILLLDQSLNLYAVWRVMRACNHGKERVAESLRRNIPRGAVVIGNVIHLYSIDRDAAGWFQPYFTVRSGTPGPYADSPAEVASLVARHPATTYLLDANQPYLPEQYLYHSHPLVRTHAVDWADLGTIYKIRVIYPFLDPLQALVPRRFVPFPGPPDLVQDYYHGRALSGAPFLREVYLQYHLYRVTGLAVRGW